MKREIDIYKDAFVKGGYMVLREYENSYKDMCIEFKKGIISSTIIYDKKGNVIKFFIYAMGVYVGDSIKYKVLGDVTRNEIQINMRLNNIDKITK